MKKDKEIIPVVIEEMIFIIRGKRVMLDTHLAELYQVPTMRLNEQMKRNKARFPEDFAFQLVQEEYESLKSQIAISKKGRGGRRYLPYVFTEQGNQILNIHHALAKLINPPEKIGFNAD